MDIILIRYLLKRLNRKLLINCSPGRHLLHLTSLLCPACRSLLGAPLNIEIHWKVAQQYLYINFWCVPRLHLGTEESVEKRWKYSLIFDLRYQLQGLGFLMTLYVFLPPKSIYDFNLNKPLEVQVSFVPCIAWLSWWKIANESCKSMIQLYARDSKERTGPKSVFTLLIVHLCPAWGWERMVSGAEVEQQ